MADTRTDPLDAPCPGGQQDVVELGEAEAARNEKNASPSTSAGHARLDCGTIPPGRPRGFTRLSGSGRPAHSGPVPDDLLYRVMTLAAPLFAIFVVVLVVVEQAATRFHRHRRVDTASALATIGFTTAIRVPWMETVYKPRFGLWVPLIGINPVAFIIAEVTAGVIGQLCQTRRVRRLPVVEWLFVTPAAHRVHHGSNPEYIDKNFGAVSIVWDRMSDTFEKEEAEVVYGIGKPGDITVAEAHAAALYPNVARWISAAAPITGPGLRGLHW